MVRPEQDYFPTPDELRLVRQYNLSDRDCLDMLMDKFEVTCPRCGVTGGKWYPSTTRRAYVCGTTRYKCGYIFSPMAYTIFKQNRIGLNIWFSIIYDIEESRGKIPALEIQRRYSVSYKTAWRSKHLITGYLGMTPVEQGEYSYEYSSQTNGRYAQPDYIAKHGDLPQQSRLAISNGNLWWQQKNPVHPTKGKSNYKTRKNPNQLVPKQTYENYYKAYFKTPEGRASLTRSQQKYKRKIVAKWSVPYQQAYILERKSRMEHSQ